MLSEMVIAGGRMTSGVLPDLFETASGLYGSRTKIFSRLTEPVQSLRFYRREIPLGEEDLAFFVVFPCEVSVKT